jgi:hypothetical protein
MVGRCCRTAGVMFGPRSSTALPNTGTRISRMNADSNPVGRCCRTANAGEAHDHSPAFQGWVRHQPKIKVPHGTTGKYGDHVQVVAMRKWWSCASTFRPCRDFGGSRATNPSHEWLGYCQGIVVESHSPTVPAPFRSGMVVAVREEDAAPTVRPYQGRCWWPSAKTAAVAQASAPAGCGSVPPPVHGRATTRGVAPLEPHCQCVALENSPAIYGWVHGLETSQVPSGTADNFLSSLTGLGKRVCEIPSHEWLGYFQGHYFVARFSG